MAEKTCPVRQTIIYLSDQINSGNLSDPRGRRISEQILLLMEEIAEGAAGLDHLSAIESLVETYFYDSSPLPNQEMGKILRGIIAEHREVFHSHIESRNCPSHDCGKLAPSPCQMACPAGIDVPTYLALIAQGKDAQAIEVIRRDNPLPWVCGLICTRPCEMMCVRSRIDTPISIKFLKAFAAERALSERAYKNPRAKEFNGKKSV